MGRHEAPRTTSRKWLVGTIVGSLIVVGGAATAAVLTLTASGIAGNTAQLTGCDTSLSVNLGSPSYSTADAAYVINTVDYSGLDTAACNGLTLFVTVADGGGTSQGDGSVSITTGDPTSGSVTLNSNVSLGDAAQVAVAIS